MIGELGLEIRESDGTVGGDDAGFAAGVPEVLRRGRAAVECAVVAADKLEFILGGDGGYGFSAAGEGGVFHGDLERVKCGTV